MEISLRSGWTAHTVRASRLTDRDLAVRLLFSKTLIAAQMISRRAADRTGGDGGKLAIQIRLKKRPMRDFQMVEMAANRVQLRLGLHAAKNQMWVLITGKKAGKEGRACQLQTRVAGLNGLLGRREIAPDKNVDVGCF